VKHIVTRSKQSGQLQKQEAAALAETDTTESSGALPTKLAKQNRILNNTGQKKSKK
jgi:hypothetical protein